MQKPSGGGMHDHEYHLVAGPRAISGLCADAEQPWQDDGDGRYRSRFHPDDLFRAAQRG